MKTIGLIGGMSWESTALYYRLVNEAVKGRLGGLHSARLLLYSVDFAEIEVLQRTAQWDEAGRVLAEIGRRLESAGAECIGLCTNTMHKVADQLQAAVAVPLIHIADSTGRAIQGTNARRIGLLGTRFTMEEPFYRDRLQNRYGFEVRVPRPARQAEVNRIIYEELCRGEVRADSRAYYRETMRELIDQGAEAMILGCTEITMLVGPNDTSVPTFDTTALHARALADFALG